MKNILFKYLVLAVVIGSITSCAKHSKLVSIPFEQIANRYTETIIKLVLKDGEQLNFIESQCVYIMANNTFSAINDERERTMIKMEEVDFVHIQKVNKDIPPIAMSAEDYKARQYQTKKDEKRYPVISISTISHKYIEFISPYGKIDYNNKYVVGPTEISQLERIPFDDIIECC